MIDPLKRLPAVFYATAVGNEPVKDWLRSLGVTDRKTASVAIATVEYGWPVGMPVCRGIGNGFWEVRVAFRDGRIGRILWCEHKGTMVLLHAFEKTTQKLPAAEKDVAIGRLKDLRRRSP
ncbi:MAG: type II toxin-antitoxin system RelE/ParE family toxin [Alphaproteobacteria bacterium]|nr:type II toxin-antitoxin system RelE/ParE family toxin [Alphaproteobacteria bacterium]MBF0373514.1 type II toxin-antitoxin system RelE/ParE family toxin [Alphaproteobacteria bacterium]MBF0392907.1 type II toxin-antitoxin system RelE/ParE family toxin [Alphaproteobacteria bacterium]